MGFYDTIAIAFIITLIVLIVARRFLSGGLIAELRKLAMVTLGVGVIACVIYYIVQLILSLPPMTQTIDTAAIILGMMAAFGLTAAWAALKARYMPDAQ